MSVYNPLGTPLNITCPRCQEDIVSPTADWDGYATGYECVSGSEWDLDGVQTAPSYRHVANRTT